MDKLNTIIENLDDVADALQPFYVETKEGDKVFYVLNLNDDVKKHPAVVALRNALDRQKSDNATLKANLAKATKIEIPEDFTAEEWDRLKAVDEELKKNPLDPERKRQHEAEVQSIKAVNAQALEREKKKAADAIAERDKRIEEQAEHVRELLIEGSLTKSLAELGIQGTMLKASRAILERSVVIEQEDGETRPKAMIKTDLEPMPVSEFVKQWSQSDEGKAFLPQPTGGGAPGSQLPRGAAGDNPYTKANWNVTAQGKIFVADPARADRLAKAAGHPDAKTARKENAK